MSSWARRRLLLGYSWLPRLWRRGWWSRLFQSGRLNLADWPRGKTWRQRWHCRRSRCVAGRRRPLLPGNDRRFLRKDALQYREKVEDGRLLRVSQSQCSS